MFEKFAQMALLYDFYGSLLTEKQQDILTLYYEDNLSLGEIALEYGISRQAVHDLLKRTEKTLQEYEGKMGLVENFETNKKFLQEIIELCRGLKVSKDLNQLDLIIEKVTKLIE